MLAGLPQPPEANGFALLKIVAVAAVEQCCELTDKMCKLVQVSREPARCSPIFAIAVVVGLGLLSEDVSGVFAKYE